MGEKCAVCGDKCGLFKSKINTGENICFICFEKCSKKKNIKIKEMSIPELKDIVREYNRKALESKNTSTQNENIVHSETVEPKINSTESNNQNTVKTNNLNINPPIKTSRKGCGCLNIIAALIFVIIVSSLWGAISKESYKSMSLDRALQSIAESENMEFDGTSIDENGSINLFLISSDYASKSSLTFDTIDIMEKFKGRDDYSELVIHYKMNLIDKKGNLVPTMVMVVNVSKETINSINYKNFSSENLPDLATQFSTHPVLDK